MLFSTFLCTQAFSGSGKGGLLSWRSARPLTVGASPGAELELWSTGASAVAVCGLSCCVSRLHSTSAVAAAQE